jgi:hypothetical protein
VVPPPGLVMQLAVRATELAATVLVNTRPLSQHDSVLKKVMPTL